MKIIPFTARAPNFSLSNPMTRNILPIKPAPSLDCRSKSPFKNDVDVGSLSDVSESDPIGFSSASISFSLVVNRLVSGAKARDTNSATSDDASYPVQILQTIYYNL